MKALVKPTQRNRAPHMSNAADTVLDEFNGVLHGLVGLYFDASTGFSFINEKQKHHLQNLVSRHQYDPTHPPSVTYSDGDPRDPNSVVYHVAPIDHLIARNEKQGPNQAFLGRSILVTIYSYWEDHYRQQLATALGCAKNEITGDIWGDIRRLRQAVTHHRGIATPDVEGCKILKWFKAGDEIILDNNHMKAMIIQIRNYFDSVLAKTGAASPRYSGKRDPGGHLII
jgi:hypothetical protein